MTAEAAAEQALWEPRKPRELGEAWDRGSHPDPKRARSAIRSQTPRTLPSAASPPSHP